MIAPISACLIVRHDPHLAATVASLRPFVSEICIFCDSPDDVEAAQAEVLADRFERSFDLNDARGKLSDWSAARNRAHALATQPWALTIDSDDLLEHGERLAEILADHDSRDPVRIMFPYDYSFDAMTGRCTRRQPRVRLVNRPECFEWRRRAHEGLFEREGVTARNVYDLRVSVRHTKRDWSIAMERATYIIQGDAGPEGEAITDPRDRFDYGMNLAQNGDADSAVRELVKYVEESGRADEKAQACLRLAELTGRPPDVSESYAWALRAHEFARDAFEPAYKLAAFSLIHAMTAAKPFAAEYHAGAAITWAKHAIETPLDSLVPYSPQDREVGVYEVWHEAAKVLGDEMGDGAEATRALEAGMRASDREPGLWLKYCHQWRYVSTTGGDRKDIVILCGQTPPWNPVSVGMSGIGGSELAVIAMARGLAQQGHRVRVYVTCGREGLYDGVEYLDPWRLNEEHDEVDLLIAWRNARFLEDIPARVKWLWLHDTGAANPTPYRLSLADRVLTLSGWHAEHLMETYGRNLRPERIAVTRNGIGEEWLELRDVPRDPHQAIYASSPDRGLEFLIAMWPRIRRRVPNARLEVFYGDAGLAAKYPRRALQIRNDLEDLRGCGVMNHGRVSQRELAAAMRGAGVYAYPTRFTETSMQCGMQALASGLRVVSTNLAALPETIGAAGVLLDDDPETPEYQEAFIEAVVDAMLRPEDGDRERIMAAARKRFAWGPVIEQWSEWISEDLKEGEMAA